MKPSQRKGYDPRRDLQGLAEGLETAVAEIRRAIERFSDHPESGEVIARLERAGAKAAQAAALARRAIAEMED
jgi:hypothetical protein